MTGLSQSQFLQALGWSTLNSFWQMAFLWCCFWVANHLFNLSASKKYALAVTSVAAGSVWFILTFIVFYQTNAHYTLQLLEHSLEIPAPVMPAYLTAASVAYLLLLVIPAYRLFLNWRFVQLIRKTGLQKIDIQYKLFVKKVGAQLGLKKEVGIYLSDLIKSPVTIGYLKPIILLPVASVNNLSMQQAEAVLLHELSHIRRYDYLINLFLSVAHTLLYFNPFVRFFIRTAENERENCCDQMVLQFGYDRVSYASALLSLEKASFQHQVFAIGAAGKKNLLSRIQKIVGIEKKPAFRFAHVAGFVAALLCVLAINTVLISSDQKKNSAFAFTSLANPFYFFAGEEAMQTELPQKHPVSGSISQKEVVVGPMEAEIIVAEEEDVPAPPASDVPAPHPAFIRVALDDVDANLSLEEKTNVKVVIENTRKVLSSVQWKEIEKTIGDVLTKSEKKLAQQEYLKEVQNINWENLEKNLKAEYERIDWDGINTELKLALATEKLDSMRHSCEQLLSTIERAENAQLEVENSSEAAALFPDISQEELRKNKNKIRGALHEIKRIRSKEVIKL